MTIFRNARVCKLCDKMFDKHEGHECKAVNAVDPDHYKAGGIETIDYLRAKLTPEQFAGYCLGNVLKYCSRYQHKAGVQDLKKAQVYLQWLVEAHERP